MRLFTLTLTLLSSWAFAGPLTLNYQGRIFDADDLPLNSGTVDVTFQILDPAGQCLIYEETHSMVDMTEAQGFLSLKLGDGTQNTSSAPNFTLTETLSNATSLNDVAMGCTGNSFTPGPADGRRLRVTINGETLTPDQSIDSSAYTMFANNAASLQGSTLADIQSWVTTNYIRLDGTNTSTTLDLGGTRVVNVADPVDPQDLATRAWVSSQISASGGGDFLKDGSVAATGAFDMGGNALTNVADPSGAQDAATKSYVDTNFYTQSNLQSSGSAQVHFDNLTNVPADIADGDADTTALSAMTGSSDDITEGSSKLFMTTSERDKLTNIETNATADMTAGEILTALTGVDGSSSNLDADRLDGLDSSHYLDYNNFANTPTIPSSVSDISTGISDNADALAMTIDSSENVGIGTASPDEKLHVEGSIKMVDGNQAAGKVLTSNANGVASWQTLAGGGAFMADGSVAMSGGINAIVGSEGSPSITFDADDETGFYGDSSDRILIVQEGTTRWNFGSTGSFSSNISGGAQLRNNNGTSASSPPFGFTGNSGVGIFKPAANTIGFSTSSNEQVRIDSSGHVGIGTSSPAEKLHVSGGNVRGDQLCIGSDCRSSWPASGTGDIEGVTAGDGLTGGGGSGSVTVDVDLATNPGLEFDSGQLRAKIGSGMIRDASGLSVDEGVGSGQILGADDVSQCTTGQKLQWTVSSGWSCVTDIDTTYANATDSVAGLMSDTDKAKLDGITAGAQPDMTEGEILATLTNDSISGDKISGGTISDFASTGIDDNASSTALTIASNNLISVQDIDTSGWAHVHGSFYLGDNSGNHNQTLSTSSSGGFDTLTFSSRLAGGNWEFNAGRPVARLTAPGHTSAFSIWDKDASSTSDDPAIELNSDGYSYIMGRTGIATSDPLKEFHVAGDAFFGTTTSDSGAGIQYQSTGHEYFQLGSDGSSVAGSGGALSIGVDGDGAGAQLGVDLGDIQFKTGLTWNNHPQNSGAVRMAITDSGNVGIGTTSPGELLSVAGVIESSSGGIRFPDGSLQVTSATSGTNNSMMSGWPDAIQCINGAATYNLIISWNSATQVIYRLITNNVSDYNITYVRSTGAYSSNSGLTGYDCVTNSWSISDLETNGRTFNFAKGPAAQWLQSGSAAYYNAGNVGIGTTSPIRDLHVANAGNSTIMIESEASGVASLQYQRNGDVEWAARVDGMGFSVFDEVNSEYRMVVRDTGRVGIGLTNPLAPLHVAGSVSTSVGSYGYLNSSAPTGTAPGSSVAVGIRADARMIAQEFNATSDERVKENIREVTEDEALRFILRAEPVHFKWKEGEENENYGFIAQDLVRLGYDDIVSAAPDEGVKEKIDDDGFVSPKGFKLNVNYNQITALLTKALSSIYELVMGVRNDVDTNSSQLSSVEERLIQLEKENRELRERIERLEQSAQ